MVPFLVREYATLGGILEILSEIGPAGSRSYPEQQREGWQDNVSAWLKKI